MPSLPRPHLAATTACLLCLALGAPAQVAPHPPIPTPPPPSVSNPAPGRPMSKADRKALLDSVDSMTSFVSADTSLPIRHRVKRRLITRDEVSRYLREKFDDDESTKRLERSELVLKRFGLLPVDFDLGPFLISLLTEQIAGFYDNKTETVNLLDWVAPAEQKPVLAHELTHALQDQFLAPSGGIEKWGDSGVHDVSHTYAGDLRHIETDEFETAREAVAEGQAMVVFFDDALRSSHRTLADIPDMGQLLDMEDAEDKSSPVLAKAPILLKESLLFPYTDGLRFEHAILRRRGKQAAFADVLSKPPNSSWEILHPSAWLAGQPVPSLPIPDLHPLLDPAYEPYDVGQMGELDVRILGEVLGGGKPSSPDDTGTVAARFAAGWKGGFYYAAQRRSATDAEKRSPDSIALVYRSRWRSADDAHAFLALFALGLHHQYPTLRRQPDAELPAGDAFEEQVSSTGTSPDTDIVLLRSGPDVLITEGLPLPLARQLRPLFPEMGATGPAQTASLPQPATAALPEPALHLAAMLHAAGTPHSHPLRQAPAPPKPTTNN